jgi:Holliday junction resolvase RusA-like endonuclease
LPKLVKTFLVDPVGKPRMTRSDRWNKRPAVLQYRAFCDEVRAQADGWQFPESGAQVMFWIPMPASWSGKKKERMAGAPHQQTPDVDNCLKALLDALHVEDKGVYDVRTTKRWARTGWIEVWR